jgi:hypothetical protein
VRRSRATTENSTPPIIQTGGQIFEDGTLIEPVEDNAQESGLALLVWDGNQSVVVPTVMHNGEDYVPIELERSLRRAVRFPAGDAPFDSTATLFEELLKVVRRFTDVPESTASLLVGFIFATWVMDLLASPINLSIWSPIPAEGARVLRLLGCFCRQALALAGTSAHEIIRLPPELHATLLIFRPAADRRTRELLAACAERSGLRTRRGSEF